MDIKRGRGEDDRAMRRALTAQEADQFLLMAKDTDDDTSDSHLNVRRQRRMSKASDWRDSIVIEDDDEPEEILDSPRPIAID
jgi:hypothetical protein